MDLHQKRLIISLYRKTKTYTDLLLNVLDKIEDYSSPHMSKEDYEAFRQIDYNTRDIDQLIDSMKEQIDHLVMSISESQAD